MPRRARQAAEISKSPSASTPLGIGGQTLVVIGHVVTVNDDIAFEVRQDGKRRFIPIATILKAAKTFDFNFIPLGCETNDAMAVGTGVKINDVEAIGAFRKAMTGPSGTRYGDLLSDLSSENFHLTIDLRKLHDGSTVPIDLVDKEGAPLTMYFRPALPQQPPPITQSTTNFPDEDFYIAPPAPKLPPEVSENRGRWIETWWSRIFEYLVVGGSLLAAIELLFQPGEPIILRVPTFITFAFFGATYFFDLGFWLDHWLTSQPSWEMLFGFLGFSVLMLWKLRVKFSDNRLAFFGTSVVVAWCQIPLLILLLSALLYPFFTPSLPLLYPFGIQLFRS